MNSVSTSLSLLSRARALEPSAWGKICDIYGPMVYSWARRQGLQDSDAEDVVQETFSAVANALTQFRKERPADTFRGWLWGITRHKISDHFRRKAKLPNDEAGIDAAIEQSALRELPETPLEDREEIESLHRRMYEFIRPEFAETTWQAFWMVVIQDQTPQEVAEKLSVTVWVVYQVKSRVSKRIREEFEDLLFDE